MELKDLIGKKIVSILPMTQGDLDDFGWYGKHHKIVLEDGTQMIASSDEEGNDAGSLYVFAENGAFLLL